MSIEFEKPSKRTDWHSATFAAAQIAIKALSIADPVSAAKTAVSAYPAVQIFHTALKGKETRTPENIAYRWLSLTLADATAQFLRQLRRKTILRASELDEATQDFLSKALDISPQAKFDAILIESPGSHLAFANAKAGITGLIMRVTTWTTWDVELWQAVFDDCLSRSSQKIFAACHEEMSALIETVSGPAGAALQKDIAWARHYEWINQRFSLAPVFSPDGTVKTPLSDLYIHLRTYWHEEYEVDREDRKEPEKRWRAYLGDLHGVVESWLEAKPKLHVRVVAGGPGSGKSSFAKALASGVAQRGRYRVLFVELQRIILTNDLYRDIGTYFERRHRPTGTKGSPGFHENPLDWAKTDNRPVLLVFDGLDEITHDSEQAKEIARNFVLNVQRLVQEQNSDGGCLRAVLLGRNAACQEGLDAASLPLETMLNVAPIRKLTGKDLLPATRSHDRGGKVDLPELDEELMADQRPDYWKNWQRSQGLPKEEMPEAVTTVDLVDLNVEPLLLHLLILSDYCGARWKEAAANRNLVYYDILKKIHARNVSEDKAGRQFSEPQFFLLMECLGLTAWRGNLRTGDEATFVAVRETHARSIKKELKGFAHADLDSMILQTHARKVDGIESGFEFIHKSFGEYLAARALITLAQKTTLQMNNPDHPIEEETAAKDWVKLVGSAELSQELLRFLRDEVKDRMSTCELATVKTTLETLLTWVDAKGMPVIAEVTGSFRDKENAQRCAETALLSVASAVARQLRKSGAGASGLKIDWNDREFGPVRLFHRLFATTHGYSRLVLGELVIPEAFLRSAELFEADLSGANLTQANLVLTDFVKANLSEAVLIEAKLVGAQLSQANLSGADLTEADLGTAQLDEANLSRANLSHASLMEANLGGAELRKANLHCAYLVDAFLHNANVSEADLSEANLSEANLSEANLSGANLSMVSLSGANLSGANLSGANLSGANLSGANLSGANLSGANLSGASLSGANLEDCQFGLVSARSVDFSNSDNFDQDAVNSIFGVRSGFGMTLLPDRLNYPEFWYDAGNAEKDSMKLHQMYLRAYEEWKAKQHN
jgi:uncharacterized protein YjbI with pentapeptide repeats